MHVLAKNKLVKLIKIAYLCELNRSNFPHIPCIFMLADMCPLNTILAQSIIQHASRYMSGDGGGILTFQCRPLSSMQH